MRGWKRLYGSLFVLLVTASLAACGGGNGGSAGGGTSGSTSPAPGSEGTLASPVLLSATGTYGGSVSVSGPSYYLFTGLTGGAAYSVTLANITNPVFPNFYSSNTNSNLQNCFYNNSKFTGTASCIVRASPAGEIFIMVSDSSTAPSTYTLSTALAVDSGQGLPTAPVTFAFGTTYNGSLTAGVSTAPFDTGNWGYYSLTGLIANHKYSLKLTASAGSAELHVYQGNYSAEAVTGCGLLAAGWGCTVTAGATSLLLQVRPLQPTGAATFTITATDMGAVTPFVAEGAAGAEVVLKLDDPDVYPTTPPNGSVDATKSYYTISGLVSGQDYYVNLWLMGDDVDLMVYTDATYTQLACASTNVGQTNEGCIATPASAGQLWIVADGSKAQSNLGSSYILGVKRDAPSQGTSAVPQIVNSVTDLPYRVNWKGGATSYYKVTGLPANTTMMVTSRLDHTWVMDHGNLSTYPASGFGNVPTCRTMNNLPTGPYQICDATTDAAGNLYVSLDYGIVPSYPVGGTAYINVRPIPVSEGSSTAPLAKNMATPKFTGQMDAVTGFSYYALSGLVANASYFILEDFGPDGQSTRMNVYNTFASGDLTLETPACGRAPPSLSGGCVATADATGRLWVQMGGSLPANASGTYYTLEALPLPVNQGTAAAPVDITGQLPYQMIALLFGGTGYYKITGLTIGSEYYFSEADLYSYATFQVYNDAAMTSLVCSTAGKAACRGVSTSGTAYIKVPGSNSTFDMTLVPSAEGTPAAPITYITAGVMLPGKVNVGASYYKATLAPNTLYTISLNSVVGDPDLHVFNNAAMAGAEACRSIKGQNLAESCQATSDANGNLWIIVDGELSRAGGTYQLKVN